MTRRQWPATDIGVIRGKSPRQKVDTEDQVEPAESPQLGTCELDDVVADQVCRLDDHGRDHLTQAGT
jgi:hypothetical protein